MRTLSNVFLASLATADLLLILVRIGDDYDSDHFWCVRIASDWAVDESDMNQKWHEARIVYEVYQICTILILPTLVMIFTYSRICTHLWIVFHRRTAMRFGHACHFVTNNNSHSNCPVMNSTAANVCVASRSFPSNVATFTASMSSESTTSTTAAAHYLNRNSTISVDNNEPGN
ncbi:G protein-coupled receptor-like protein, partial [Euroglyphus maynei]